MDYRHDERILNKVPIFVVYHPKQGDVDELI